MNKILQNTHKQKNVYLLKIRDYYFNKAKKMDWYILHVSGIPVVFTGLWLALGLENNLVDLILGLFSISVWIVELIVRQKINQNVDISNQFREQYDIQVFDLYNNRFIEKIDSEDQERYQDVSRKTPYSDKYEIWYEEIFSEPKKENNTSQKEASENANIICCQADNLIYGAHVYEKTAQYHRKKGVLFTVIIVLLSFIYLHFSHDFLKVILIITSVYGYISIIFEQWKIAKDASRETRELIDRIKSPEVKNLILAGDKSVLRELQDMIVLSRKNAVFVPQKIRNSYLGENNNPFYIELDDIKNMYYENLVKKKPSSAEEIDTFDENGNKSGTLQTLHEYLYNMLIDIVSIWDEVGIHYVLDGGTLIGAVREEGKFIFWDDDIDLAVPYEELERAKTVIIEKLSEKYSIQDSSEMFYSPRLSNFRIRDCKSVITEKDSDISVWYKEKGIFIDVYSYSPILRSIKYDSKYRRWKIHPLNRKLMMNEFKLYRNSMDPQKRLKYEKKFINVKKRYLKRINWYLSHAKNRKYWSYTPNYLNFISEYPYVTEEYMSEDQKKKSKKKMKKQEKNFAFRKINEFQKNKKRWKNRFINCFWLLKKPQPYIEAVALWGESFEVEKKKMPFGPENQKKIVEVEFNVPNNPDVVLHHCYGDYMNSPYIELKKLYDNKEKKYIFSSSKSISSLKHIKTVKYL